MARRYMRSERAGATLQTTALVNEVYLRLVDVKNIDWQRRAQFSAIAAQMMRRILNPFSIRLFGFSKNTIVIRFSGGEEMINNPS